MYNGSYGADDIPYWVVDDDYLFEPTDEDLIKIFGPKYSNDLGDSPMIGNTRKNISFEVGRSLNCKDALDINNNQMFLGWLGISPFYWEDLYFSFRDSGNFTSIEFEIENYDEMKPDRISRIDHYIEKAEKKFKSHMESILDRISKSIDAQFEDDQIEDRIISNEYKFDEKGNPLG